MASLMSCSSVKNAAAFAAGASLQGKAGPCRRVMASRWAVSGRRLGLAVQCEAKSEETPASPAVEAPPKAAPIHVVKMKTSNPTVAEVFAFGGPAPETINGRLAMLGFVTALIVEAATGTPLSRQLGDVRCLTWFIFCVSLFSAASLVPLFQGISPASRSGAFFTVKAEVWNGRAAMLGLAALAITEYVRGSALV